jgi:hypothetical protein
MAAKLYIQARRDSTPFDPQEFGFEFSIQDVEGFIDGIRAANLLNTSLKK